MRHFNSNRFYLLAALPLATSLMSCGKNSIIQNVTLQNKDVAGQTYIQLGAEIGLNIPELIPVVLPIDRVGTLTVYGKKVTLEVNATEAFRLHHCDGSTLPNGTALPVSAPSGTQIACVPVGGSDSRVYLGFNGKQWLAGFALTLKMKSPVNIPLNVMLPIPLNKPNLQAVGGTFFGPASGLAVFAVQTDPTVAPPSVPSVFADSDRGSRSVGEFKLVSDPLTSRRKNALIRAYYESDDEVAVE